MRDIGPSLVAVPRGQTDQLPRATLEQQAVFRREACDLTGDQRAPALGLAAHAFAAAPRGEPLLALARAGRCADERAVVLAERQRDRLERPRVGDPVQHEPRLEEAHEPLRRRLAPPAAGLAEVLQA